LLFDSYYCGFKNNKLFKMAKKKYKTGLVLSGGGTRGFAHIGALQALNDNGIFPDIVSGVSAGSIVMTTEYFPTLSVVSAQELLLEHCIVMEKNQVKS